MQPLPSETDDHALFRATVRAFVEAEITPFVDEWDEAGTFPRDLYRRAGAIGMFGLGFAEDLGGLGPLDPLAFVILAEELARSSGGGVAASLFSNYIGAPPIQAAGSREVQEEVIPRMLSGEVVCALGITEPSGGSDVANLTTRAAREGDEYVVTGEKTFITSGMRADYLTAAVRTGGPGAGGVSMLVIPTHLPGYATTPMRKMGWWASDTATIHLDGVRVPSRYLLGEEHRGFEVVMRNFNTERLFIIAGMAASARVCFDEALAWAKDRRTFGQRLADHQVIRHKLVEMDRHINATRAWMAQLVDRVALGESPVAELAECKVQASLTMEFCAREAAQVLGGASYLRGNRVERIYRDVRVNAIGGGSEEIMRDLAARQLGI